MADYVEVVDAGPGWTKVRTTDGEVVTVEGARNWRNNNPGNLEYGPFAQSHGAIGTDGRFAVFPTYDVGRDAKSELIFDSPNYRDLSLTDAIYRYAPAFENPTGSYINHIAAAAGVSPSTAMSAIPLEKRAALLDAMQDFEGWEVGTINGAAAPQMAYAPMPRPQTPAVGAINAATQPAVMRPGWQQAWANPGMLLSNPGALFGGQPPPAAAPIMRAANAVQQVPQAIMRGNPAMTVAGRTAVIDPIIKSIFNGPKKANVGSGGYDRTTGTFRTTLNQGPQWQSSGPDHTSTTYQDPSKIYDRSGRVIG